MRNFAFPAEDFANYDRFVYYYQNTVHALFGLKLTIFLRIVLIPTFVGVTI